jgi:hypothetical protein
MSEVIQTKDRFRKYYKFICKICDSSKEYDIRSLQFHINSLKHQKNKKIYVYDSENIEENHINSVINFKNRELYKLMENEPIYIIGLKYNIISEKLVYKCYKCNKNNMNKDMYNKHIETIAHQSDL